MTSADLFARARQLIPGGVNSPVRAFRSVGGAPFFVKSAQGATLTTADDRELIDFVCTWGPAIHGHNHPLIRQAIAAALERGTSFGTPNPLEVDMAEMITRFVPSIQKVRLCNSGTEATMSAIRLARGFTRRDKIIKFSGCDPGHSASLLIKAGSGALTHGNPDSAGVPASFARETIVLPYNDAAAVEAAFAAHPGEIAAVIVEPYPANVGLILPLPGYLAALRAACTRAGALLIFDEVMTGFRLAKGGVQEIEGITPDLTTLGKIIGGGLPVGAFGGRADVMDHLAPLGPVYQAGTLSGNPLAMAAGIADSVCSRLRIPTNDWPPWVGRCATRCWTRHARRACLLRCHRPARCSACISRLNPCTPTPTPCSRMPHFLDVSSTPASRAVSTCHRALTRPASSVPLMRAR